MMAPAQSSALRRENGSKNRQLIIKKMCSVIGGPYRGACYNSRHFKARSEMESDLSLGASAKCIDARGRSLKCV